MELDKMYTVTYPLELGQEVNTQLHVIKNLTREVIKAKETLIGETIEDFQTYLIHNLESLQSPERYTYEQLLLGCSWRQYYTASSPGNPFKELFIKVGLKKEKPRPENPEYTMENLTPVLDWIESKGDFLGELSNLRLWRKFYQDMDQEDLKEHLQKTVVFADWFKTSSRYIVGKGAKDDILYYVKLIGLEISGRY